MLNRKEMEKELYSLLETLTGSKRSSLAYKKLFKRMSNKQVEEWLRGKVENNHPIDIVSPIGEKPGLTVRAIFKTAKKMGLVMRDHLWIPNHKDKLVKTKHKALLCMGPVRRASQSQDSKINVPDSDKRVDFLSGQPTADSSGHTLTRPELELLASYGMTKTANEFRNIMGGDPGAYRAASAMIANTGEFSQVNAKEFSTGMMSTHVVRSMMAAALVMME
jgi:hypothetical protein